MNKKTNNIDINKKILIIRLSSIGDIVLTSPIIRAIKNSYNNSEVYFLTFENFKDTIIYNPKIDKKVLVSKKEIKGNLSSYLGSELKFLKEIYFDVIIDLQNNHYSKNIISNLNYSNLYKINKRRLHKLSLIYFKKPLIKDFHIVNNYFSSFKNELGIKSDNQGLEFWVEGETDYLSNKKEKENDLIISIAPGAAHKTKQWLPEYFVELINLLSNRYKNLLKIQLLGSTAERKVADYIEYNARVKINNFVDKTSLMETAKLIDNSNLLITNDTGLMHIAAARQTPIVAIFGSSVRELGFIPYKASFKIVEKTLWCRPCSHIGRNTCPLIHFNCMKQIRPEEVFLACVDLINQQ